MIVAGEASGDMHGAHLARALAARRPKVRLFGMGGRLMQEAGVRLLFNPTSMSTVGFVEALRSYHVLRRVLLRLGEVMDHQRPDAVVLIDFPGFNLRLAELAKRKNVPVVYYFSPSVWAWGRGRADRVAATAAKVCSVFPFEADVYREAGCDVVFVGHPLLDLVRPSGSRQEVRAQLGLQGEGPVVALLPGSRQQEVDALLPIMIEAARQIQAQHPGARFPVAMAHTVSRREIEGFVAQAGPDMAPAVQLVEGRTYDVLLAADVALVTCGTATLEAALLETPMVAMYRVSSPTYFIAKRLLKIPYVALPNIVAGRQIVPELLQHDVTAANAAREALALLDDPAGADAVRKALAEVRTRLGEPGAVGRVAATVLEVADGAGAGAGAGCPA